MKQVSAEEFGQGKTQLLMGTEPFEVVRDGQVIGIYRPLIGLDRLPSGKRLKKRREADRQLEATLRRVAEAHGLTVEALEELLTGDLP